MGKDVLLALLTAGAWLLLWAIGVVIQESITRPWYRRGPWGRDGP